EPLKLGILGGLGPAASAYFLEMITSHTKAQRDQDHIDILLSSRASTPDRTDFILGKSDRDPLPVMIRDAKYLESCNVSAIVIPCNTAHYFIDEIRRSVSVPMPSIITETVSHIKRAGHRKAGILATEGTLAASSYQLECERQGLGWEIPSEEMQKALTKIIYGEVKRGEAPDVDKFNRICAELTDKGCDTLILGCTELSLIKRIIGEDERFTDSLEVLAYTAIKLCGHEVCGFGADFDI
ncbi:MAG: aspartate/glutamate racemase family protein, partial [Clostridia bacterium]|nr:aspartate/glutamate racemase family protein [Clostridia bacterium]